MVGVLMIMVLLVCLEIVCKQMIIVCVLMMSIIRIQTKVVRVQTIVRWGVSGANQETITKRLPDYDFQLASQRQNTLMYHSSSSVQKISDALKNIRLVH
jgi:hypothetical protein